MAELVGGWHPGAENGDQRPGLDVVPHVGFDEIAESNALQHGGTGKTCLVQRDRPLHIDLKLFAVLFEPPAKKRAVRQPASYA